MTTLEKLSRQLNVTPRHHTAYNVLSETKAEIERLEHRAIEQEEVFKLQAQWHTTKAQEARELAKQIERLEKENAELRERLKTIALHEP